jgi:microcompartment protein CcmK/EutM
MRFAATLAVVLGVIVSTASAADIGVSGKKLIIVDKTTLASRAKVVFVAKDKAAGSADSTCSCCDSGCISTRE